MDNTTKELSSLQLKLVKQSLLQIESLLKLHIQNKEREEKVQPQKNIFKVFIDNSNEIFYNTFFFIVVR